MCAMCCHADALFSGRGGVQPMARCQRKLMQLAMNPLQILLEAQGAELGKMRLLSRYGKGNHTQR